jgi:putative zinc finger/helix-turn-helix YgiT family protein
MELKNLRKEKTLKGVDIEYATEAYVCPECGVEAGTVDSAGKAQRAIADAYREKIGLLTGWEIKSLREAQGKTQQQLAEAIGVGVASIKRWETGMIQTRSMDSALRRQLRESECNDCYTGNRETDLARIKLVARTLERILGKELLKENDRFLFLAKYLWYVDMLAFRELKKGLTGASYAAIPYGPQLNNYKDLLEDIKRADTRDTMPLSEEEFRVVRRVAETFPDEHAVYDAAHREKVWRESRTGALISYFSAHELAEIE